MLRYTWRTFIHGRGRVALSIGGVALAMVLIIVLDAVFLGAERQATRYIDHSGADVIVSQEGVRTMHMAASTLPLTLVGPVRAIPGVASVTPILFASDIVRVGEARGNAYVVGLPPDAATGVPPESSAGAVIPGPGGAIIDQRVAEQANLGIGDTVTILGQPFRIDGLSRGTAGLVNSVVIITLADFASIRGSADSASFLFIETASGEAPDAVAARISTAIDGVTVQTRAGFAAEERALIRDMGANIIRVMNLLGFVIGLAVMALAVYLAMLSRQREFGMLKALGAANQRLYRVVVFQALASVGIGFVVAVALTAGLGMLLPRIGSNVALVLGPPALARALLASLVIAGLASLLPIRRIARLDPAMVFRKG